MTSFVLFKDKQNRLALRAGSKFIFFVDHYTAENRDNTNFFLYGKKLYTSAATDFDNFYLMCTEKYRGMLYKMIHEENPRLKDLLRLEHSRMFRFVSSVFFMFSLGWLNLTNMIPKKLWFSSGLYFTGKVQENQKMKIPAFFFDRLTRVENVENQYIDVAKFWEKSSVASSEGETHLSEKPSA